MSGLTDDLPEALSHAYDAFEVIRRLARAHEDQSLDCPEAPSTPPPVCRRNRGNDGRPG